MNKKWYLYAIASTVTDTIYVGKTNDINRRWSEHKLDAKSGVKYYLYNAIRKYKIENFYISILEEYDTNELAKLAEIEFIKIFKTFGIKLYNLTNGGDGALGCSPTEETKLKLSIAHKGKKLSKEHKLKISISTKGRKSPNKNKKFSKEHKEKLSTALTGNKNSLGRTISIETRIKLSDANKGKNLTDEHKLKISNGLKGNTNNLGFKQSIDTINKKITKLNKPIIAIDNNGNEIYFQSIKSASKTLKVSNGYISDCLKGKWEKAKWEKAKGYVFKYVIVK